jgi:hypothetical protein
MDNNILIGGAAGQGMKSLSHIISIAHKRHGYHQIKKIHLNGMKIICIILNMIHQILILLMN